MSITISTLATHPNPFLRFSHIPFKPFFSRTHNPIPPFPGTQSIRSGNFSRKSGFSRRYLGFVLKSQNGEEEERVYEDEAEREARGQSTMPERFRYLTKEAPDPPVRWPYFIALAFLIYAWRTVLWELGNWKKAVLAIVQFFGYLSRLALALIFHFIGDPVTSLIRVIETTLYTIRGFYSGIVAYAPIPELTTIIVLASVVLSIGEATVPDSVSSQPYVLTIAGLIGFAAVRNFISEPFFWMLLLGLFGLGRFIKKRDYITSILPVAAVLAAVGEPWIRVAVIGLFSALAILQHSKNPLEGGSEDTISSGVKVPVPLLCAALAIGIRLAAKWAGYRHLTWMVV